MNSVRHWRHPGGSAIQHRTRKAMHPHDRHKSLFAYGGIAEVIDAEERFSMAALGRSNLNLSKQESALDLREALINLSCLSKTDMHLLCTDRDKQVLTDAGDYLAAHPDPDLSTLNPNWNEGIKFCDSQHPDPRVTVNYVTTGAE
ncbi:hypothetical protein [Dyella mobilis]|uniref:Uncharacterized protein n=1 Tax=Dyella mobilis TaxID=1849582 RepID=A0ABS2KF22_9GAMM|nr:hypothetical protein [Dyella mobilis]MBM7129544.1 hypothetical protein [Dyella mobilis]GLQ98192.1 hypothetical protein GCM10007863_26120 [Dyella mobilis]